MSPLYGAAAGSSTGAAAAAAAAAGGATWSVQGFPSVMAVPGGMVQGDSPQQMTSAAMVSAPWMHTGMGWVPAGRGMGQPMLAAMPGMQPGMQQALVQTSLVMPGMQVAPAQLIPVGPGMLDGFAAGFAGMSLQDQAQLNSSTQGHACMPAMLQASGDNNSGMVHGSSASAGYYDLAAQQGVGGLQNVGQLRSSCMHSHLDLGWAPGHSSKRGCSSSSSNAHIAPTAVAQALPAAAHAAMCGGSMCHGAVLLLCTQGAIQSTAAEGWGCAMSKGQGASRV